MLSLHFNYLQSELFFTCKDLISSLFFFSVVLFSFHYSIIYKQQECTTENKQKKIRFQEDAWIWKAKISSLRKRRTAFWSLLDVIDKNIKKKKTNQTKRKQPTFQMLPVLFFFSPECQWAIKYHFWSSFPFKHHPKPSVHVIFPNYRIISKKGADTIFNYTSNLSI